LAAHLGGTLIAMHERLERLEQDLRKVQGVQSVRVVGDEEPTEIHIVSSLGRTPKQVVRDVQSLAAARFDMPIDHRIVSVVQLDEGLAARPLRRPDQEGRPVLDRVVVANTAHGGWVKVALRWPSGEVTEGAGAAGATREARARGATVAFLQAVQSTLEARDSELEVDHVLIHRFGSVDAVLVRAVFNDRGRSTPVVGSALVHDDVATAAVQALLQAANRKLASG
jgi:hypothetical protein